jgi:general secretion pathway protein G
MTKRRGDRGFTLIELLLVIVVLGILATIVVASLRGVTGDTQDTSCESEAHILHTAGEAYFAQHPATSIAAVGASDDRYELELVEEGFLHQPSRYYDLNANGDLHVPSGSPCTA